ncbi:hypothetical protein D3C75_632400 [compost metagenome]
MLDKYRIEGVRPGEGIYPCAGLGRPDGQLCAVGLCQRSQIIGQLMQPFGEGADAHIIHSAALCAGQVLHSLLHILNGLQGSSRQNGGATGPGHFLQNDDAGPVIPGAYSRCSPCCPEAGNNDIRFHCPLYDLHGFISILYADYTSISTNALTRLSSCSDWLPWNSCSIISVGTLTSFLISSQSILAMADWVLQPQL